MIEHKYKFRLTYPYADRMRTMYHANYAKYNKATHWAELLETYETLDFLLR